MQFVILNLNINKILFRCLKHMRIHFMYYYCPQSVSYSKSMVNLISMEIKTHALKTVDKICK